MADQATQLMSEPEWRERDRNAITIATTDRLRVTLTALHAGAEMGSEETNDTIVVQALRGRAHLSINGMDIPLGPGHLATVEEPGRWRIVANTDALLLLTAGLEDGLIGR
jgi:quercetin dioxygenase-like cupin family protein